jgi:hypothetical protein
MGRKKFHKIVDEVRDDLDIYLIAYNTKRPHQGRGTNGRTQTQAFTDQFPKKQKPSKMTKAIAT